MIQLKEKLFDLQWLEDSIERKCQEFQTHEKFGQRIHTIYIINKTASHVSDKFFNESLVPILLKLATDPVPNIKFNVSKAIEVLYERMDERNKEAAVEALKEMETDALDFDVRYYAVKALKSINSK